eukprot:CAMPEP_0206332012 /NCGR_PEP_ID=MMETSP0106_2-20121207/24551_1 /ASSEMBLY_ACC=CAM_ASM_000206 /TAXON_ID=81532 /ORGANISM="Acanthoeca-like sp., Strain 10tr" /LENGTH=52 /DNA_ID=CAMNT_0053764861 /DNA_START=89 /DNA_END=244 /DNA_ORIENTATION=-
MHSTDALMSASASPVEKTKSPGGAADPSPPRYVRVRYDGNAQGRSVYADSVA